MSPDRDDEIEPVEPLEAEDDGPSEERFYLSFWFGLLLTWFWGTSLGVTAALVRRGLGPTASATASAIGIGMLFGAITCVILVALWRHFYPVVVDDSGIRSHDLWGLWKRVGWDEVLSVRRLNFGGLRYLLLRPHGGSSVWVPLFLDDRVRFRERVLDRIDDQHPLTPYLTE